MTHLDDRQRRGAQVGPAADRHRDPPEVAGARAARAIPHRRTAAPPYWIAVGLVMVSIALAVAIGPVAVALVALVSFGAVLFWLLDTSPVLAALALLALLGAAWASLLTLYETTPWLDLVVHTVVVGLLAAVATQALLRHHVLARPSRWWVAVGCAVTVGLALASIWEMLEWIGHTHIDPRIGVGYDDTISDIATGGAGALLAGGVLARREAITR